MYTWANKTSQLPEFSVEIIRCLVTPTTTMEMLANANV